MWGRWLRVHQSKGESNHYTARYCIAPRYLACKASKATAPAAERNLSTKVTGMRGLPNSDRRISGNSSSSERLPPLSFWIARSSASQKVDPSLASELLAHKEVSGCRERA